MAKEDTQKQKKKLPTAEKREIQNERKRLVNKAFKTKVRTSIRDFEDSLSKGSASDVKEKLSSIYATMDKGVKRGLYKQNKANRTKARLAARAATKA